ncbi:MAG: UvrD-helicase domain-containing protein [Bacillota bacterium]
MEQIYVGPTGSGKTTKLQSKYHQLAKKNKTDNCLVILNQAAAVTKWRSEIELDKAGQLNILTYFGFINQELQRYWDLVESKLSGTRQKLEPTFMTVEPTHYLMTSLVKQAREGGSFIDVNATEGQIALQLINNLNYGALNTLQLEQVKDRLTEWGSFQEQEVAYQDAITVMNRFRKICVEERCLDYSLVMELYNQYLLEDDEYYQHFKEDYQYLFVDDLEKTSPAAQDLIANLITEAKESYLTYNPAGGFEKFFGAAPELASDRFMKRAEIIELGQSHIASPQAQEMAQQVANKILAEQDLSYNSFVAQDQIIKEQFRGAMLEEVAQRVEALIESGVEPCNIALIAPQIDKILEFALEKKFKDKSYSLLNLRRDRRILDNSFAEVLIVLTILTNPDWNLDLNFSSLVETFDLILDLDPVRSALLANRVEDYQLPDLNLKAELRERIGFNKAKQYDEFRDWVQEKRDKDFELEYFFREAFGELLAPLLDSISDQSKKEEIILSCRKLMDSIVKFKKSVEGFKEIDSRDIGCKFIEMVLNGTIAAELLFGNSQQTDKVVLATPYTFLSVPDVEQVEHLFLLDLSSELWLLGSGKELSNPYILSRENDGQWGDKIDQNLRKEQLAHYLQGIFNKVTTKLYLADSDLSSRGWEQDGRLGEWLVEDKLEVSNNG